MRLRLAWGLVLVGVLVAAGERSVPVEAQRPAPAAVQSGITPGSRVLVDAHNAYPSDGKFTDRIDRALSTGLPLAIEQDLVWYVDPATGVGRSVVSHGGPDAATAPTLEAYFFAKVAPIMKTALEEDRRAAWPLITLNLDFKTNEPEHHAAVWALLGKYEAWLTTADRIASSEPASLRLGPMLVLTGSNDVQQASFHDNVAVGQRLRLFGAIGDPPVPGADRTEKAQNYTAMPVETLIAAPATNYRRWANFSWAVIEVGGAATAADWTSAEAERLRALVARAHAMNLWIRFYTLNGHTAGEDQGWGASYNFGSADTARLRWKAAIDAHADFIASDQYEALARLTQPARP